MIARTARLLFPGHQRQTTRVTKRQSFDKRLRLPPLRCRTGWRGRPTSCWAARWRWSAGFRRGRQGLARSPLRGQGSRVVRDRDRPDLRAAGGDGGLPGRHPRGHARDRRPLHHHHRQTATSSAAAQMARMKDKGDSSANIGPFSTTRFDMAGLKALPRHPAHFRSSRSTTSWRFPDGHSVLVLAEGRSPSTSAAPPGTRAS